MRAADQIQINRLKAHQAKSKSAAKTLGKFQKQCPRCRRTHHIRKHACDCGLSFHFNSAELPP
jgi:hypothetical protein